MAHVYSDWITYDDGSDAQRVRLKLHMQEISDLITATVSSDGDSRDASQLVAYLAQLRSDYERLFAHTPRTGRVRMG